MRRADCESDTATHRRQSRFWRRCAADHRRERVVRSVHFQRAPGAHVVADLRNNFEYSLLFSPFATNLWSRLSLVDTPGPAEFGILPQLLHVGRMYLPRRTQKSFEIYIFIRIKRFGWEERIDRHPKETREAFHIVKTGPISS